MVFGVDKQIILAQGGLVGEKSGGGDFFRPSTHSFRMIGTVGTKYSVGEKSFNQNKNKSCSVGSNLTI